MNHPDASAFEACYTTYHKSDQERDGFVKHLLENYDSVSKKCAKLQAFYQNETENREMWQTTARQLKTELTQIKLSSVSGRTHTSPRIQHHHHHHPWAVPKAWKRPSRTRDPVGMASTTGLPKLSSSNAAQSAQFGQNTSTALGTDRRATRVLTTCVGVSPLCRCHSRWRRCQVHRLSFRSR